MFACGVLRLNKAIVLGKSVGATELTTPTEQTRNTACHRLDIKGGAIKLAKRLTRMISKPRANWRQVKPVAIPRDDRHANDLFQLGNLF